MVGLLELIRVLPRRLILNAPYAASEIPSKLSVAEYSGGSMNSSSLGQIRISANTWFIAGIPDSIERCPGSECLVVDRDDRL